MEQHGYPSGRLADAFTTATTHSDAATRERAEERVRRWFDVLGGMDDGTLRIGSRTPVADLPAWVTPEVVRGGFATGRAAAGGPLLPHETDRLVDFVHALSPAGRAGLCALLDSGEYRVEVPEEAALLVLAWLVREEDFDAAEALLHEIAPFARRLRFVPTPAATPPSGLLWRETAGEASAALAGRTPNPRVAAMNEALTVWNPFADDLLALWLDSAEDGRAGAGTDAAWPDSAERGRADTQTDAASRAARPDSPESGQADTQTDAASRAAWPDSPESGQVSARTEAARQAARPDSTEGGPVGARIDAAWRARAEALVARYAELSAAHTLTTKHRNPRHNLAILLRCTAALVRREAIGPRDRRLLEHTVAAMVARRGRPGSPEHTALRAGQSAQAALPTFHDLARLLVRRAAALPADEGVPDVEALLVPVHEDVPGIPLGTPIPRALARIVRRALAGTVEDLVDAGVVPSAEVLARLVPPIAAETIARAYPEGPLRALVAAVHVAFRRRRSLLLLNFEHQVTVDELPWVRALARYRADVPAHGTVRRLGELALDGFPGTVLPNQLVREFAALAPDLPWVEDLAADIFMGSFTPKFAAAARIAGDLLAGSLYARYYGLDYSAAADRDTFAAWCRRVADPGRSVAASGMVIEQAQILTTHNLATLVRAGVEADWAALAERAFGTAARLAGRIQDNPRTAKNVAFAWRQMLFFLTLGGGAEDFVAAHRKDAPPTLAGALAGLAHVVPGGSLDEPLLGWVVGRRQAK
ncbi:MULTISPECIES: hypothetical protein [unclassified Saccharothrix]|uniref:hypothetical protein n=1 Tax=unclassified Saccharothrix TaxID=2593673 RepID=UPI00307D6904